MEVTVKHLTAYGWRGTKRVCKIAGFYLRRLSLWKDARHACIVQTLGGCIIYIGGEDEDGNEIKSYIDIGAWVAHLHSRRIDTSLLAEDRGGQR